MSFEKISNKDISYLTILNYINNDTNPGDSYYSNSPAKLIFDNLAARKKNSQGNRAKGLFYIAEMVVRFYL